MVGQNSSSSVSRTLPALKNLNFDSHVAEKLFRPQHYCWRVLGLAVPENLGRFGRWCYYTYAVLLHVVFTFGYPLHLTIKLFHSEGNIGDIFKNLAINLTCVVCILKTFVIWWKLGEVTKIYALINRLHDRVKNPDEVEYYNNKALPSCKRVRNFFGCFCIGCAITSEVGTLVTGFLQSWQLMYPGSFPFDVYASTRNYVIAHIYQFIGVSLQITQDFINDTLCPMGLALLAGHCRILSMRISKIGLKNKNDHSLELLACMEEHKLLMELRDIIQDIVSACMFFQIGFTSMILCVVVLYIVFYVHDAISFCYYVLYFMGMAMEIYPTCYYGSSVELEFEKLSYALFSCDWVDQDKKFKQDLRIFTEQTLRSVNIWALGMFRINLNAFFACCRTAYSLSAVLIQAK